MVTSPNGEQVGTLDYTETTSQALEGTEIGRNEEGVTLVVPERVSVTAEPTVV